MTTGSFLGLLFADLSTAELRIWVRKNSEIQKVTLSICGWTIFLMNRNLNSVQLSGVCVANKET